jgi:hypothetical protein
MAKANDPPLTFGEIIDRIEQMREELLMLQRSLEKMELADSEDGAANGIKVFSRRRALLGNWPT